MKTISRYGTLIIVTLFPSILMAQVTNPLNSPDLSTFLLAILDFIVRLSVPIIILAVVYAGFLFVTAGDNTTKLNNAKAIIVYTLIGAVIILGARLIAAVVQNTVANL